MPRRKRLDEETLPIFILTHGRPEQVTTFSTLQNYGWRGPVYLIVDNEDPTVEGYKEKFGDSNVIVFDKAAAEELFDTGDNFTDRKTIVFARNACFEIARSLGYRYFLEFDDDYTAFEIILDGEGDYNPKVRRCLTEILSAYLDFYKSLPPTVKTLAMAQGGDFIGGREGQTAKDLKLKRKAMNSFLCDVERPFRFLGRINEDVNTYVASGATGDLFLTAPLARLIQANTQTREGGMTTIYQSGGTYIKSFYTVMFAPACVSITDMGPRHRRLHHRIQWNNAVPRIVSPDLRKAR